METGSSGKWRISVCGLNCAACDIYSAGHGNDKMRDEILEWFKKERNEALEPEQIRCEGCTGPLETHWSSQCKMMLCAKKSGLQHCFQCEEFLCPNVDEFSSDGIPHHKKTIENSKRMKEIGIAAWIREQRLRDHSEFCP